ncbi:hypothetical protein ACHAPA_010057 [Fusarium lateritium]
MSNDSKPPASAPSDPPPSFQETMAADPPIFKTQFACITFNKLDRLRFINFPDPEVVALKETIKACWKPGVVQTRPYGESTEMWLRGTPWMYNSNGNDDARRLLLAIMEGLFNVGWVLQGSMDVIQKSESKDSLIFRKQDPVPPPCDWLCVSFDNSDKLKIVGGPPQDLTSAVLQLFKGEIRRREVTPERLKIHLAGLPWSPSGTDTVKTRIMLLRLIETLERYGFTIYATVGSKGDDEDGSTDVLVCQRQKDWVPGAPVWHR